MDTDSMAVVMAVIMASATIAAWVAALQTRKAALGHMLIELSKQYGSNEMLKSMKVLRKWKKEENIGSRKNFEVKFVAALSLNEPAAMETDIARRTYFTFFDTLRILHNRKILDRDDIEEQIGNYSVQMLFEIIEPMEFYLAIREERDYGHKTFDLFRKWNPELDKKFPTPEVGNHLEREEKERIVKLGT